MQFHNLNEIQVYVAEEAQNGNLFSVNVTYYQKLSAAERRRLVRDVAQWIASEARQRGFEWGKNWWMLLQCIPMTQRADQCLIELVTQNIREGQ